MLSTTDRHSSVGGCVMRCDGRLNWTTNTNPLRWWSARTVRTPSDRPHLMLGGNGDFSGHFVADYNVAWRFGDNYPINLFDVGCALASVWNFKCNSDYWRPINTESQIVWPGKFGDMFSTVREVYVDEPAPSSVTSTMPSWRMTGDSQQRWQSFGHGSRWCTHMNL